MLVSLKERKKKNKRKIHGCCRQHSFVRLASLVGWTVSEWCWKDSDAAQSDYYGGDAHWRFRLSCVRSGLFSLSLRHQWVPAGRSHAVSMSHWLFVTCLNAPNPKDVKQNAQRTRTLHTAHTGGGVFRAIWWHSDSNWLSYSRMLMSDVAINPNTCDNRCLDLEFEKCSPFWATIFH